MNRLVITEKGIVNANQLKDADFNADQSVYEVIRLMDGIALYLEDHFERLVSSVKTSGIAFNMTFQQFQQNIQTLSQINGQFIGNVKFILSGENKINRWTFSFIPHSYPLSEDYQKGVPTGLLFAERNNPGAKIIQHTLRERANQLMAEKKFYEVLLVDRNGCITEGSRSNVFFLKDNVFYTAPSSQVLAGVTRKKVLECLEELKYTLVEEAVLSYDIASHEAVFLTGTSPKVLPINSINDHFFKVNHPFIIQLMNQYNLKIEHYIASKKG